jgi:hypothetical protein
VKRPIALLLALTLTLVTLATQRVALAAAPSNDNFANATLIPAAGFVDRINTSEATLESNEPSYCYPISNSVWYKFSAGSSTYNVYFDTAGSDYPASMTLYLATPDGLQLVGCNGTSPNSLTASPGETWYVQVTGQPESGTTTGTTTTGTTTGTTGTGTTGGTTTGGSTGTTTATTSTGTTTGSTTGGTTTGGTVSTATATSTTASGNLVFTVTTVLYVPIDVSFTIDPRGTVNAAGDIVVISGTVTCSRAANLSIGMNLTQVHARRLVAMAGGGADLSSCGPTRQAWTATLYDGGPIRFGSGAATVDAYASAYDDHGSGSVQIVGASVRLKH